MTPDLDALTALLAAALATLDEGRPVEIRPYRGDATDPDLPLHHYEVAKKLIASIPELPSLIEAARREAVLREALEALVVATDIRNSERVIVDRGQIRGEYGPLHDEAIERLRKAARKQDRAMTTARALLHDNAGTATGEREP